MSSRTRVYAYLSVFSLLLKSKCHRHQIQIVVQYAFKRDSPGERHGTQAERMLAGSNQTRHLPNTMFRAGINPALQGGRGAPTTSGVVPPPPQVDLASVRDSGKMGYGGMMGFRGNQFGSVQPSSIPPPPPRRIPQIVPPPSVPGVIPPRPVLGISGIPQQRFNVQGGYGGFSMNPPPPPSRAQFPPVMPGGGGSAMWGKMPPQPPMSVPPPPPPPLPLPLYHNSECMN